MNLRYVICTTKVKYWVVWNWILAKGDPRKPHFGSLRVIYIYTILNVYIHFQDTLLLSLLIASIPIDYSLEVMLSHFLTIVRRKLMIYVINLSQAQSLLYMAHKPLSYDNTVDTEPEQTPYVFITIHTPYYVVLLMSKSNEADMTD